MSSRNRFATMLGIPLVMLLGQSAAAQQIPMNGLALWLDASNPASLSGNTGDDVTTWLDLSGNNFDAMAGDAAPIIGVWPNNGEKAVSFSGGGQALETPDYAMIGSFPYHIFVVEEYVKAGGDGTWLSSANPSSGCCGDLLRPLSGAQPEDPDGMRVFSGPVGFPDGSYDATSGLHPEGTGFIEAINRALFLSPGSISAFSTHREGDNRVRNELPLAPHPDGNGNVSQVERDEFPEHALTIGRPSVSGGTSLTGSIAEIVVYERELSASESTEVQDYLFDKWLTPLPDFNEWGQTGVGAWSDGGNWITASQGPGPPNDNTRIAKFGDKITSPQTVSVNTDVTVQAVQFESANSYAVAGPGSVTLEANSGNAAVNVMEGSHELQVRVNFSSETDITADPSTQIDFYNGLTLGGNDLNISGDGQVNIHNIVNSGGGAINSSGNLAASGSSTISGDLVSTGTISVDLAGTGSGEFDSFHVGGLATLSGLIDVELTDGYTPSAGDAFNVLTAGSIVDNGLSLTPESAELFKLSVSAGSVILSAAIPEPASLLLFGIALVGIGLRRQPTRKLQTTLMAAAAVVLLGAETAVAQIPTDDLQVWFDATTLTGNEGDLVTTWADQSGNGRDAVMASFDGAEAPTVGAWPNSGLPTVRFTGGTLQALVTNVKGAAAGANVGLLGISTEAGDLNQLDVQLLGSSEDGELSRHAQSAATAASLVQPWLRDNLAVSIIEVAPVSAGWSDLAGGPILQGSFYSLPVQVSRGDSVAGNVRFRLETTQVIPKKKVKKDKKDVMVDDLDRALRLEQPTMLDATTNQAALKLWVPVDLPIRNWDLSVVAELLAADNKTVVASVATPVATLEARVPMKIALTSEATIEARAGEGETGHLKGTIQREAGYAMPVSFTLQGLPKGYPAPTVEVAGDVSEFDLEVRFPDGTKPVELKDIQLVGTVKPDPAKQEITFSSNTIPVTIKVVAP